MKKIFILLAALAVFSSCLKIKEDPKTPDFNVTTAKTTYKVGDVVTFSMTGNPDYITFFSGENGNNYNNLNRLTADGIPKLQFTSARANGVQANSLHLLISTDFKGVVGVDSASTVANIAAATWTDITSRATLSTGTAVASGAINLSDFPTDKPVYIAFKYNATAGSIQNKWTITALTLTNTLPDGSVYTIANLTATAITNYKVATLFSPGWVGYVVSNKYNWIVASGTSLTVTGANILAQATAPAETWALSGGILLNRVSNEAGVAIKEGANRLTSNDYQYTFTAAGTYVVSFVASNTNTYGNQEVVKQITVTITP